ncbi:MAG: hypothetical protein KDA49_14110 [Rhodospirillaceae bacterium]|nr:hypothetical protein [Rhodospirillaceae bacterium]
MTISKFAMTAAAAAVLALGSMTGAASAQSAGEQPEFMNTCSGQMADRAADAGADPQAVCACMRDTAYERLTTVLSEEDAALLLRAISIATDSGSNDIWAAFAEVTGRTEDEAHAMLEGVPALLANVDTMCLES